MVKGNRGFPFSPAQRAILTTILYSDIFSFPLTEDELWRWLISDKKLSREEFTASLKMMKDVILQDGYYCLKNHEETIIQRKKNLPEVAKKMELAKQIAKKLSHIPSILFIGISGGLAAGKANATDDIDFVIITKKNTLFTTRLFVLIVLEVLGVRRSRSQKKTANTICLNLLFDETLIDWFRNHNDVYTAREIAQIFPLFERNDIYRRFLKANDWIKTFLPNVSYAKKTHDMFRGDPMKKSEDIIFNSFIESLLRWFQIRWMRGHQTKEVVMTSILAFHPNDYRASTLRKLRLRVRQFGLLTKF